MRRLNATALLCLAVTTAAAAGTERPRPADFGQPIAAPALTRYAAIAPSGSGLPPGHGDAASGAMVYAQRCAACHGDKLQGATSLGAPPLVGGRGTLTAAKPLKTVESYWPYATTVFDYVKRAMPFNAPGSLSDDEVYAVTAYVLAQGHVIDASQTLDAHTLPAVRMPNRDGFVPDPRPR